MQNGYNKTHLTASTVIAPTPAGTAGATSSAPFIVHTLNINTAAATAVINLYDYNSTSSPPASSLVSSITVAATADIPVPLILDAIFTVGITVTIATAAADVTVTWT